MHRQGIIVIWVKLSIKHSPHIANLNIKIQIFKDEPGPCITNVFCDTSQKFQPMASQLSKKAALPLAKILATCRNNISNTGPRGGCNPSHQPARNIIWNIHAIFSTWITNHNFQMRLLIGCQQSCQPIRSHIRKSRLVNHDFNLVESIKTTSMEDVSTGVLEKQKMISKDKAEKWCIKTSIIAYVKIQKKWRHTIHYVKPTAQLLFKNRFPKGGPTCRRQVVNPRRQTPQGQSVAKPETPLG